MAKNIQSRDFRGSTALHGIMSARAEGTPGVAEINAAIARVNTTFEEFKAANDSRLAALEKGKDDVVTNEKVDRINNELGKVQEGLDGVSRQLAAAQIGGGAGDAPTAEQSAHAKVFNTYFRKGKGEDALADAQTKVFNAGSVGSDPEGGWLVPAEVEKSIDRVQSTLSSMRGLASVRSISTDIYKKPVGQGGTTSGWVGEKDSRPETNTSTLSILEFPAMELYAMPAATQKLLDDAYVDIGQWLADEVSITFAEQEGIAFVSGDGVNQPKGLLSYTVAADASYAWGKLGYIPTGAAANFDTGTGKHPANALIDLCYAPKQAYRNNGSFLTNRKTQAAIRKFTDDSGQYLWQPPLTPGQPASLLGYPVATDDNMDDLGANKYPVAFGDFKRGYLIIDRIGVRVLRDPFSAKPYVLFYTTKRVGGGVQNFEAIKLLKCATS